MKITQVMKEKGSVACRFLSEKAMSVYADNGGGIGVYEIESEDGKKLYGVFGDYAKDGMTFDELDDFFCDLADS